MRTVVVALAVLAALAGCTTGSAGPTARRPRRPASAPEPTRRSWSSTPSGRQDRRDLVAARGIPAIAEAFPGVTPTLPSGWPDDRFDVVWTFTRTADGWHFAQLPELLPPDDRSDVIDH